MRVVFSSLLCCVFLLMDGRYAFANSPQEIRVTLEAGSYDLAVEQGIALGTADGLVLAVEALNSKLLLGKTERKAKTAKKAMKLAKAALVLEPQNAEAQIQYALAYGFYGRHASDFTAWRKKLAQKIYGEIEKAAILAPDDERVEALKGAWHLNLLYRAGNYDVGKRYGANMQEGITHFKNALEMSQGVDIIILSNFLMLQFALQPEMCTAQTEFILQNALLTQKPGNDVERQILIQMQNVYDGFEGGNALGRAKVFLDQ